MTRNRHGAARHDSLSRPDDDDDDYDVSSSSTETLCMHALCMVLLCVQCDDAVAAFYNTSSLEGVYC
jgi:hypothetical protein